MYLFSDSNYITKRQPKLHYVNNDLNDELTEYFETKQGVKIKHLFPEKKINQSNDETILSNATFVVIVAYMRSGSSLLGAILSKIEGAFYLFEPITEIANAFNKEGYVKNYLHGNQR